MNSLFSLILFYLKHASLIRWVRFLWQVLRQNKFLQNVYNETLLDISCFGIKFLLFWLYLFWTKLKSVLLQDLLCADVKPTRILGARVDSDIGILFWRKLNIVVIRILKRNVSEPLRDFGAGALPHGSIVCLCSFCSYLLMITSLQIKASFSFIPFRESSYRSKSFLLIKINFLHSL